MGPLQQQQPLAPEELGGHFTGLNVEPDATSTRKTNDSHTAFDSKNEGWDSSSIQSNHKFYIPKLMHWFLLPVKERDLFFLLVVFIRSHGDFFLPNFV